MNDGGNGSVRPAYSLGPPLPDGGRKIKAPAVRLRRVGVAYDRQIHVIRCRGTGVGNSRPGGLPKTSRVAEQAQLFQLAVKPHLIIEHEAHLIVKRTALVGGMKQEEIKTLSPRVGNDFVHQ